MAFLTKEEMQAIRLKSSVEIELSIGKKVRLFYSAWAGTEDAAKVDKSGELKSATGGRDLMLTIARRAFVDDNLKPLFPTDAEAREFLELLTTADLKLVMEKVREVTRDDSGPSKGSQPAD